MRSHGVGVGPLPGRPGRRRAPSARGRTPMPNLPHEVRARRSRPHRLRQFRPRLQDLERRALLSAAAVEPTAEEQYALELINDARADPAGEGRRLVALAQSDPVLAAATSGWDLNHFLQVISAIGPQPPLAFDLRLNAAARVHDGAMLAQNSQVHSPPGFLTNPTVATDADGQPYFPIGSGSWATGENIYAYSQAVNPSSPNAYADYFHAAFLIDWGNPDFGHLENVLAPGPGEVSSGHPYP